jgi:hypothetical protein
MKAHHEITWKTIIVLNSILKSDPLVPIELRADYLIFVYLRMAPYKTNNISLLVFMQHPYRDMI